MPRNAHSPPPPIPEQQVQLVLLIESIVNILKLSCATLRPCWLVACRQGSPPNHRADEMERSAPFYSIIIARLIAAVCRIYRDVRSTCSNKNKQQGTRSILHIYFIARLKHDRSLFLLLAELPYAECNSTELTAQPGSERMSERT